MNALLGKTYLLSANSSTESQQAMVPLTTSVGGTNITNLRRKKKKTGKNLIAEKRTVFDKYIEFI